jgi:anti-sigma-K factor RskA
MTCAEFKGQVAAFALGVLEADERAACERHLAQREHEGCLAALAEANDAIASLGLALPPLTPSAATWSAIESRTRTVAAPAAAPRRRRWAAVTPWLVAAALLLALLVTLRQRQIVGRELQASLDRSNEALQQRVQCASELAALRHDAELRRDAVALLQLSGTRLVALAQQGGETAAANVAANIIWHSGVKRGYVVGRGLAAPAGKDYELWVIRGERKIPAGILHGDASGALLSAIDPRLLQDGAPDAIAVTLEAGEQKEPRGPIVLVGKI